MEQVIVVELIMGEHLLVIKMKKYTANKILFIGFMRFITLNIKLWGKPPELGWKR